MTERPVRDLHYPALPSQTVDLTETLVGPSEIVKVDPLAEQNRQLALRLEEMERRLMERLDEHAGRLQRLERTDEPDDGR